MNMVAWAPVATWYNWPMLRLNLIGEGKVWYESTWQDTATVFKKDRTQTS